MQAFLVVFILTGVFYPNMWTRDHIEQGAGGINPYVLGPERLADARPADAQSNDTADTAPLGTPTPTATPTATPMPTPDRSTKILLSAAGDCTLGYDKKNGYTNSLPDQLEKVDGDYGFFFRNVLPYFSQDDVTVVNLETTFTKASIPANKTFTFKGDPSYTRILTLGSVEVVNLANNHTMDYLEKGFTDTVDALRESGVRFFGMGYQYVRVVKGVRMGFLGYKNNTPTAATLKSEIENLRNAEKCQIVVVTFHWGSEYSFTPNTKQTSLGRAAVDYGADLVLGHHPHVINGIELYKGKYIVYSLGNFSFGGNKNPADKDTFIFQQTFSVLDGTVSDGGIDIIPCSVSSVKNRNNYQPTPYGASDAARVIRRINEYSDGLKYGIKISQ